MKTYNKTFSHAVFHRSERSKPHILTYFTLQVFLFLMNGRKCFTVPLPAGIRPNPIRNWHLIFILTSGTDPPNRLLSTLLGGPNQRHIPGHERFDPCSLVSTLPTHYDHAHECTQWRHNTQCLLSIAVSLSEVMHSNYVQQAIPWLTQSVTHYTIWFDLRISYIL